MKKFLSLEEAIKKYPVLTPNLIKMHVTPYIFHDGTGGYYLEDVCRLATRVALKNSEKSI